MTTVGREHGDDNITRLVLDVSAEFAVRFEVYRASDREVERKEEKRLTAVARVASRKLVREGGHRVQPRLVLPRRVEKDLNVIDGLQRRKMRLLGPEPDGANCLLVL
jgi:hypothetical protein